jgi:SAM-dependent methyltransferase
MSYRQALSHYSSCARSDFVKRAWERPQFVSLLTDGLRHIVTRDESSRALRVVDVGAGAGEGYHLLREAFLELGMTPRFDYWAIDSSSEMLALGKSSISRSGDVEGHVDFIEADMRSVDYSSRPADLFLSIGAPYSHLERGELRDISSRIFAAMASRPGPAAAIFDVLGRYSVEWIHLAAEHSRSYEMSFFAETSGTPTFRMTFYSRADLDQAIGTGASSQFGARADRIAYWDRSVFVGRHSSTGRYNPNLPRIRPLVNALAAGGADAPERILRELRLTREHLALDEARMPSHIADHLEAKRQAWNTALGRVSEERVSPRIACEMLRAVDQSGRSDGVGAAHSLTACVYVRPEES